MKKFNIPKKERKDWINALLSGNYKQTTNTLARSGKYCCLGVYGKVVGIDDYEMTNRGVPAELNSDNRTKYPRCLLAESNQKRSFTMKLANMNDNGKTFKQIATYIKKNTIGV
jgi:hypothetical protein